MKHLLLTIAALVTIFSCSSRASQETVLIRDTVYVERQLNDWQLAIMAIASTESRFDTETHNLVYSYPFLIYKGQHCK